jgi:hypothetical protein
MNPDKLADVSVAQSWEIEVSEEGPVGDLLVSSLTLLCHIYSLKKWVQALACLE